MIFACGGRSRLKTGKNYGIIFAAVSYFNIKYYKRGAEMKVLIINGSPRVGGNTSIALEEMRKVFEAEGVEVTSKITAREPVQSETARQREQVLSYRISI